MVNPIFPPKENSEMSDREWETYCIQVPCCNSLNERGGSYRREGKMFDAILMERAQTYINFLLEETGRV